MGIHTCPPGGNCRREPTVPPLTSPSRYAPSAIDELVVEISELRPLPTVGLRIMSLIEQNRFSAHELATLIAGDQVMTSKLLRLANSAYYGFPRRIATVRDAVV